MALRVAIASPLDAPYVERMRAAQPEVSFAYEPDLLPPVRYVCDHRGDPDFARQPAAQARWEALLRDSDVWYGVPTDTGAGLAAAMPLAERLRWVQATAAGAGEQIRAANLDATVLERVTFTSAAGVHGAMLAEFAFYGLLALRKDARRLHDIRARRAWDHYALGELAGQTMTIVGLGGIGRATATRAKAFDMHVIGVARSDGARDCVDELVPMDGLRAAIARADAVVLTLPGTDATRGIVDRDTIAALKPGAIVCNVGRGSLIDQAALTVALRRNAIAGAVLDVTVPEPLPPDDALWTLPNVILAPHTAALSVHENARIVDLFCDNLGRFLRGEPLRNQVDTIEFY